MDAMTRAIIYSDGGCNCKTRIGGWGAVVYTNGLRHDLHGGALDTTNNRMELQAAIEAIRFLENPKAEIILYSDSQYVIKGITEYVDGWRRRGWRLSENKPIKNPDLWQTLYELDRTHNIEWRWVKGHSNSIGNQRADWLATAGIKLMIGDMVDYEKHLQIYAEND